MIKPHIQMIAELGNYASPKAKITRLLQRQELIQVKQGLFLAAGDNEYSLKSMSSIIYGPSYVSFESALSYYNLIPERVSGITCATFRKNKNREFHTPVGDFYYYYLPAPVYPYEVVIREENGQNFLIATPEKAICDSLYKTKEINNIKEIGELLLSDWRVDLDTLMTLDISVLESIVPLYRKKICRLFLKWLAKEKIK
ncbi:MAG: hypothetical protein K9N06_08410 [Candidatus Cloacimonetes bacterium]|nr:hypothetical protein [Candidatus Cloacimonadota bacterium]